MNKVTVITMTRGRRKLLAPTFPTTENLPIT